MARRTADQGQGRSARHARHGRRWCRVTRDAPGSHARRIAPAGAGHPVHVTRISAEMTMALFCETPTLSRRALLVGGASLTAWACLPRFASAAGGRDPRFIAIILRGALDGLSCVGPVGDPNYASLHGD